MKINHFPDREKSNEKPFGPRQRKIGAATRINAAIKTALDELESHSDRRDAFLRLLACVRAQTGLLKPTLGQGSEGWVAAVFLINRLRSLASRQGQWYRSIETWRAQGESLRLEFRSLVHHLFARHPVPGFMDAVWDLPAGPEAFRQQMWYIRLARGSSLRSLNLPVALTRRMEHHARHAPDHYTPLQAVRHGETRGLGGSVRLAGEIAAGRLGRDSSNAPFWRTVLRFFVVHTEMPLAHLNPIIEFIHASKFAGEEVLTANGCETRAAPWPTFAIEGRTLKSLLRLVSAWNPELTRTGKNGFAWLPSGFQAYRYVEKRTSEPDLDWVIVELLNSSALHAEGRAMRHCVYTYADKCRRGEGAIWSLRLRINDEEKRMATIEVNPRWRSIVQVRAKWNRKPGLRSKEIIQQWAAHAGLEYDLCK